MKLFTGIAILLVFIVLVVAVFYLIRKKAKKSAGNDTPNEWVNILSENSRVFNGLYGGLLRVCEGKSKKPEKIIREWCQRANNRWADEAVDVICKEQIEPLIEKNDVAGIVNYARLLLKAAEAAGITHDEDEFILLDEEKVSSYIEWDGKELEEGLKVEILAPAWYQNGKLIEQGSVRLCEGESKCE